MGKVYLVGAGPGDPELLTIKAVKVISRADVILYDRLISEEVLSFARPTCKLIYVGKEAGRHTLSQQEINRLLLFYARSHSTVVRLKGGDPTVFGRGGEELMFLAEHGIPCEVVPGVSSVYSVPAYAGIPLTVRGVSSSFAVVTGHPAAGEVRGDEVRKVAGADTVVVLMGVKRRSEIARELMGAGRCSEEPVAFVERGTTKDQRVVMSTLGEVAKEPPEVTPPAVMVVGRVVELAKRGLKYPSHVPDRELRQTSRPLCEGRGCLPVR